MKKRYIVYFLLLLLILQTIGIIPRPVQPFIQLAGEVYPGSYQWFPFGGLTNTFVSSILAYIVVLVIALAARARSRTADEVPTGYYNFIEMAIEGMYGFIEGIAGSKAKDFFPWFMTFLMLLLTTNLMAVIPGYDSIGLWESKPFFNAHKDADSIVSDAKSAFGEYEDQADAEGVALVDVVIANLQTGAAEGEPFFADLARAEAGSSEHLLEIVEIDAFAAAIPLEEAAAVTASYADEGLGELLYKMEEAFVEVRAIEYDAQNLGDLRGFTADDNDNVVENTGDADFFLVSGGTDIERSDWTIVPFVRPAATDLSFNLALALVSMFMVQVFGFRYQGLGYLKKFFVVPRGFNDAFKANPIEGIKMILNSVVGIIELISEISKVISFSFRLLGAIFGGMVLLFVIAELAAVANLAFFGLEMFIGPIQAFVFSMLSVIFMLGATESHHDDHGDHH